MLALVSTAACSSDGDGEATPTTVTAAATTTEAAGPPPSLPADCPDQPDSSAGSPAPAQGSALADGMYFGYITALDAEDLKLTFDAAQLLSGDAANKAAAEDGGESPPPNDYWIRNASKATRALGLTEDAVLCTASPEDIVTNRKVSLAQVNQALGDGEPLAVWIDMRGGTVVRVQQQYFP